MNPKWQHFSNRELQQIQYALDTDGFTRMAIELSEEIDKEFEARGLTKRGRKDTIICRDVI